MPVVEYVAVLLAAEPGSPNATKAWRSITDAIDSVKHSRSCLGYYICECVPLLLFCMQTALLMFCQTKLQISFPNHSQDYDADLFFAIEPQ